MRDYIVSLDAEEEKALLWDVETIQAWLNNTVQNKIRRCTDEICRLAIEDQTKTILTRAENMQISQALAGEIIITVERLPLEVKRQIVAAARVKSAAERQAEFEAEGL